MKKLFQILVHLCVIRRNYHQLKWSVGVLRKCFGIVVKTHYVGLQKVLVIYPGMLGFIKKAVFNSKTCFSNYQGAAVWQMSHGLLFEN